MSSEVRLYTTSFCGFCVRAKQLLGREKIPYTEVNLDGDQAGRVELVQKSGGKRTVPQIFVGDVHVGGFDELARLHRRGGLDPLLVEQGIQRTAVG
jgi:glutaredoxin 3